MSGKRKVNRMKKILKEILPLAALFALALVVGYLPHFVLKPSLMRIALTTALCEAVLVGLSWKFLLDDHMKSVLLQKLRPWKARFAK